MLTWTNQPNEEMWNHLKILKYKANAKSLLSGKMESKRTQFFKDGDILEKKSSQVSFSIAQAYQYFHAADLIEINTSPLLYFYGMLSLTKSLIVANHPTLLLEDMNYHGLYSKPVTAELKRYTSGPKNWTIENEYAVTNEGVFREFMEIVLNFSFPKQSILKFKDVASVDPQLSEIYERYYNEKSKVQYLYSLKKEGNPPFMEICPRTTEQSDFEERISKISDYFNKKPEIRHTQALVYLSKESMTELPENLGEYHPEVGGRYLVSGLLYENDGAKYSKYIPPEFGDYINMFILSDCVRYKQEFWGNIIDGNKTGSLAVINLFISIVRNRFPNFILNQLFNEEFHWGTPARLI